MLVLCENTCESCGGEVWCKPKLDGSPRKRRFCSSRCIPKKRKLAPRRCQNCGKTFYRRHDVNTRYCSISCSHRHGGGWHRFEKRVKSLLVQIGKRNTEWLTVNGKRRKLHTLTCVECGATYKNISRKSVCCSKVCSTAIASRTKTALAQTPERIEAKEKRQAKVKKRKNPPYTRVRFRRCRWCGEFISPRQKTGTACDGECTMMMTRVVSWAIDHGMKTIDAIAPYKESISRRRCDECGDMYTPEYPSTLFCSNKCCRKQHSRIGKAKRRARKYRNGAIESINPIEVFDRDGWRCYVCGVYTPKSLRGTIDDRAPELDHVVPLAAGGTHTHDNVKCCCRSCNQDMGATTYQQDMFIGNSI